MISIEERQMSSVQIKTNVTMYTITNKKYETAFEFLQANTRKTNDFTI